MITKNLINKTYHTRLFSWLFPTTVFCLRKNLRDCESVLDLGCGSSSPLKYCKNIKRSVGVEAFESYIEESKKRNIHSDYIQGKVEETDFPEKSFDAVIMIELIEHLPKQIGFEMLKKVEKWAKKKIILSTPNGFLSQRERDGNSLQEHLSGWDLEEMKKMGFKCYGLSGLKSLRREAPEVVGKNDFMASISKRPKFFWFIVATLSQAFTYRFPKHAFEIFCVRSVRSHLSTEASRSDDLNQAKKIK